MLRSGQTKESSVVERKPGNVNKREVRREACAFANSLSQGEEAVIFVGLHDVTGAATGIKNMDALHKLVDEALTVDCYPAIKYETRELSLEGRPVLAVVIPASPKKPHFSGPAFVRNGAKTTVASEEQLNDLLLSKIDKCREILRYKHSRERVSVRTINYKLGSNKALSGGGYSQHCECYVEQCTAFAVTLCQVDTRARFTEELTRVSISFDDEKHQPLLLVAGPGKR